MIKKARVKVNEKTAETPWQEIDPLKDSVTIDQERILPLSRKRRAVLLNKPAGFITAMSDDRGRPTVGDLVKGEFDDYLFHVGRLDKDTEGLLLMTNDGQLAHEVAHPSSCVEKTYLVETDGKLEDAQIRSLREGLVLPDGFRTSPARVRVLESDSRKTVLEMVIREGHKRQIREMFACLGKRVIGLTRTAIGEITIEVVPDPGDMKELSDEEIKLLRRKKGTV